MAPHELSAARRASVLRSARWSWVHLTSAGADFIDLADWPADTLLTRSWRCYAAPLAEYALHAVLTHERRRGAPWQERDTRSAPARDAPPVPAGASTGGGAGLWGAEVTVAGWGAVGQRLAAVLDSPGASVTVLRRSPEPGGRFRQTADLGRALDADHLVVALPLTAGTRHLFDRVALGRARPGLHLVNITRAAIVDQEALTELCAGDSCSPPWTSPIRNRCRTVIRCGGCPPHGSHRTWRGAAATATPRSPTTSPSSGRRWPTRTPPSPASYRRRATHTPAPPCAARGR